MALYKNEGKITWTQGSAYDQSFEEIEGVFLFNELMDTFPVERLCLMDGKVVQKYVTLDEDKKWVELWEKPTSEVEEQLDYMENELGYTLPLQEDAEEPLNPDALKLQKILNKSLKKGAIFNIDYGRNGEVAKRDKPAIRHYGDKAGKRKREDLHLPPGESEGESELLRGYYNPGNVDITTDVNFRPLIAQARKDGLKVAFEGFQRDLLLGAGTRDLAEQYYQALEAVTTWPEYWSLSRAINGFFDVTSPTQSFGQFFSTVLTKGIDPKALKFKQIADKDDRPPYTPYISIDVGKPNTAITTTLPEKTDIRFTDDNGIIRVNPEEFSIKPEIFAEAVITYKNDDGEDVVLNLAGDEELQKRCSQLNSQLEKSSLSIHEYCLQVTDLIRDHSSQAWQKRETDLPELKRRDTQATSSSTMTDPGDRIFSRTGTMRRASTGLTVPEVSDGMLIIEEGGSSQGG